MSDNLKKFASQIVEILEKRYPEAPCALEYNGEPWKLLVMARLSAQCTDARVNIVCRELFKKYPTAKALAEGELSDIEKIVYPCGLYRVKSAEIKEECRLLTEVYGGVLPDEMDELLKFPGVGRKVANLLLGDIYKKPAVVTDTHCIRISGRLGLVPAGEKNPVKVERILSAIIEKEKQSDFCHRLVMFGRDICSAKNPRCDECPLADLCKNKKA
ncbi:MAG: endonuclease III [Clostridia bacterium]|jgi:endonuclease-3|nr:endonuclease III [Clostridia bacterium]